MSQGILEISSKDWFDIPNSNNPNMINLVYEKAEKGEVIIKNEVTGELLKPELVDGKWRLKLLVSK